MKLWSGVFGLDGNLRLSLAAPEVVVVVVEEEGGGGGVSKHLSGLCWLGVLLSAPWSLTEPTSQPSSVALPLMKNLTFSHPTARLLTLVHGAVVSLFPVSDFLLKSAPTEFSLQRTICSVNAEEKQIWAAKDTAVSDESPIKLPPPPPLNHAGGNARSFTSLHPHHHDNWSLYWDWPQCAQCAQHSRVTY